MFGFFRTLLALWVMAFHLVDIPVIGPYAVFSFFILSGFLMTTIMHESYGYGIDGIKRYAANRFLRLYPMYWAVAIFSSIAIFIVSEQYSVNYKDELYLPNNIKELIFNTSMIFPSLFPYQVEPRLSPPTWALTIEIFFYICIALGVSKTKGITLSWVGISVLYNALTYIDGLNGSYRYATIFGASLPFALGAWLYFYKIRVFSIIKKLKIASPNSILLIYTVNAVAFSFNSHFKPFLLSDFIDEIGKYLNIILSVFVITSLFYRGAEVFSKKFDKIVGDFSYPIYLGHWQCGLIASFILFDSPTKGMSIEGWHAYLLALVLTVISSYVLIHFIDKNISLIRDKIKADRNR